MGDPLGPTKSKARRGSAPPPASHWSSLAFWAWWAVLSVLVLYAIAVVIPVEAPDDVSVPWAVALNASNLVVSLSAAYVVAGRRCHNGVLRRPPSGGTPEEV